MPDTAKRQSVTATAIAFVIPTETPRSRPDIWAETGRTVELAYREPAPIGQTVRVAIALALLVVVKLCAAGVLR